MGGQLSCHFCEGSCEGSTFRKMICNTWCCCYKSEEKRRDKEARKRGVVYVNTRGVEQFVLLNTPFIEVKEWVVLDDIPFTTITMFFEDPEGNMRLVMHHEPHDVLHRMSRESKSTVLLTSPVANDSTGSDDESSAANIKFLEEKCEAHQGALVEDVIAPHLRAPIIKFMRDTLEGTYYQMHGMFNSTAKLIRTFPVSDYNNVVVGGIMMIGAFTPTFDDQLQQFVLNTVPTPDLENADIESLNEEDLDEEVGKIPSTAHLGRKTPPSYPKKTRTL
jgi:hypothetical protein